MTHVKGFESYGFGALCLWFIVCVAAVPAPAIQAQQSRTARDGVYSAAQAKRGEAVYLAQCGACHGATLAGDIGPPLTGQDFLGIWDKQTVADLFDKIHNTMPADNPGALTRPQVAEVIAYILQVNKLPAGGADLADGDAALKLISMPTAAAAAPGAATAAAGGAAASFPAVGTMNQVMRGILFPSANVLFDVQTQDPGARDKPGTRATATTTTARYGDVYAPWQVVDAAAISIAEMGPTLMTPGRRCENGKPVPVDRADWQKYVQGLVETGRAAYKASQTRNQETVSKVTNDISDACANCHRVYRDVPTAAERCMPPR